MTSARMSSKVGDARVGITALAVALLIASALLPSPAEAQGLQGRIVFDGRVDSGSFETDNASSVYGSLLLDTDGDLYVSWRVWAQDLCTFLFARSTDGGRTFDVPVEVVDCTDAVSVQLKGPSIAALGGEIHLAWAQTDRIGLHRSIRLASSFDGGRTFAVREVVTNGLNATIAFPVLTFVGSRLYVGWSDDRSETGYHAYLAFSDDGGRTFSDAAKVNDDFAEGSPQHTSTYIHAGPGGVLYVAWSDEKLEPPYASVFVSKTLDGTNFTPRVRASQHYGSLGKVRPLSSGTVHAAWRELIGSYNVVYGVSRDGGETWSQDRLFTEGLGCGYDVLLFDMASGADGRMYVALTASEHEDDNSGHDDLFLGVVEDPLDAVSRPAGEALPSCIKVNPGDVKTDPELFRLSGQEPSIAVNPQGQVYVLYFMRESSLDVGLHLALVVFAPSDDSAGELLGLPFGARVFLALAAVAAGSLISLALLYRRRRRRAVRQGRPRRR